MPWSEQNKSPIPENVLEQRYLVSEGKESWAHLYSNSSKRVVNTIDMLA